MANTAAGGGGGRKRTEREGVRVRVRVKALARKKKKCVFGKNTARQGVLQECYRKISYRVDCFILSKRTRVANNRIYLLMKKRISIFLSMNSYIIRDLCSLCARPDVSEKRKGDVTENVNSVLR